MPTTHTFVQQIQNLIHWVDEDAIHLEKAEILEALRHFGFADFRTEQHPNVHGSALLVAARKV